MKHSYRSLFPPTNVVSINEVNHIFNSLAKPYLEALHAMLDEEEGELEEEDDKEEGNDDDLYSNLIDDEFIDSDQE